jgi:cleavage and polyadenylation specificity factor subunit 4
MSIQLPANVRDILRPQFHQNNFSAEHFIKHELGLKLDTGSCCYF